VEEGLSWALRDARAERFMIGCDGGFADGVLETRVVGRSSGLGDLSICCQDEAA
jgi:hypothetical protein